MECEIELPGIRIAAKRYGDINAPHKVLCLHGWLDCADSFALLAPAIAAQQCCVMSIDLPGHGKSGHFASLSYSFINYSTTVIRIVDALGWRKSTRGTSELHLLAHSMGGAIGLLVAGLIAGEIDSLCLLDPFIGWGSTDAQMPSVLMSIAAEENRARQAPRPVFSSVEVAAHARVRAARSAPGDSQIMSLQAAQLCVQRSLRAAPALPTSVVSTLNTNGKPILLHFNNSYQLPNSPTRVAAANDGASPGLIYSFDPHLMAMTFRLTPLGVADVLLEKCNAQTKRLTMLKASQERPSTPLRPRQMAKLTNMKELIIDGAHHVHIDRVDAVLPLILKAFGLAASKL
jgi:pimeloyl-ACP methyl ester carboxylesterase